LLNYRKIRKSISEDVVLVAAAKTRSLNQIIELIDAGATDIGQNYIQEAQNLYNKLGDRAKKVRWHMIGHLQRNKVKKAIDIFDIVQTLDSIRLAAEIDKRSRKINKIMPVLVEVNSGEEEQKSGVMPEEIESFIKKVSQFDNIQIVGLMTMGPQFGDPEDSRPYFIKTKKIFNRIKDLNLPNVNMQCLSMGMSNSYQVAIQEGSNMVRIGTAIFDEG